MPLTAQDGMVSFRRFLDNLLEECETRKARKSFFEKYLGFPVANNSDIFRFNRKEPKMKLDTDAIKRRFEEAVVVGWNGSSIHPAGIHILLPDYSGKLCSIVDGNIYDPDGFPKHYEWIIRKGDKCHGSNGVISITVGEFLGFSGDYNRPFVVKAKSGNTFYLDTIRPIPQLTERQKKEQALKDTIEESIAVAKRAEKELEDLRRL